MSDKRLFAVGRCCSVGTVIVSEQDVAPKHVDDSGALTDEDWEAAMQSEIDSLPVDPPDFVSPDFLGAFDADEGLPCDPTGYYVKLGDIESYVLGFKDAVGAWQGLPTIAPGQRVRWLYRPRDSFQRGMDAVAVEVSDESVTIRIEGPDGAYFRKVHPRKLFAIPVEMQEMRS